MWLLNVNDFRFEEVPPHGPFPRYAILSHCWMKPNSHEVSFQDIQSQDGKRLSAKAGWVKIVQTARLAKDYGLGYVWIDTCCINKENPTELAESINCMFNWYREARVCFTFLEDFEPGISFDTAFRRCQWIRRGWTLQELIAPHALTFFDGTWSMIGTRAKHAREISTITRIDEELLRFGSPSMLVLNNYSVAQRMSWAAGRETTRPEDRAYSLVGLFGIVMQTHYGEGGASAFKRLQENIIRVSADQSIFAWPCDVTDIGTARTRHNFFAHSPDAFRGKGHIIQSRTRRSAYSMSNVGLHIDLPLTTVLQPTSGAVVVLLNCTSRHNNARVFVLQFYATDDDHSILYLPFNALEADWFTLQTHVKMPFQQKTVVIDTDPSRWFLLREQPWRAKLRLGMLKNVILDLEGSLVVKEVLPEDNWSVDGTSYVMETARRSPIDGPGDLAIIRLEYSRDSIRHCFTVMFEHQRRSWDLSTNLPKEILPKFKLVKGWSDEPLLDDQSNESASLDESIWLDDRTEARLEVNWVDNFCNRFWDIQVAVMRTQD